MRSILAMMVSLLLLGLPAAAQAEQEAPDQAEQEAPDQAEQEAPDPPTSPFDHGGFAPEDPWLADLIEGRKSLGLPSDKPLVVDLMTKPAAQAQVARYGAVLTPAEEARLRNTELAMEQYAEVMAVAENLPSYAGARVQDDKAPYELTVWVGGPDAKAGRRTLEAVESKNDALTVRVEERQFSIAQLSGIANRLGERPISTRVPGIAQDRIDAAARAVDAEEFPRGTVFGYSMRHGTLTAHAPDGVRTDERRVSLGDRLPMLDVLATADSDEDWGTADQGSAACGRFWCGAPKGGHIVRFKSGTSYFRCTWAGSIRVRTTSSGPWSYKQLTAGHCGSPNQNEIFYNYANQGASLNANAHFAIVDSSTSTRRIGTEWRNSTERAGQAWGDFSLVSTESRRSSNLILTGSTTTARVTQFTATTVDLDVCISARSTGVKCDEVNDIGWTKTIDGKEVTHLAIVRGSYDANPGDSGAPLYKKHSPHRLVGVHHGSKTNWAGLRYQLFSRVTLIDDSPNMGLFSISPVPTNGKRDFVAGLYARNLNRLPDSGGYNYWMSQLNTCNVTNAKSVARSFLDSQEFKNRFPIASGSYSNKVANARLRVWYAYRTFFGRDPDAGGLNFWLDYWMVDNGIDVGQAEPRWLSLTNHFGNSIEFGKRTNGPTALADGAICA